uniref:Cryptochrome DASH n=1 Tax=Chromera velia CCMP2878 TaxID=1169474 RepID=A0A0G4ICR8_9ALVE|mmetsp:Transcript_34343/g.67874  ORF Transcript_34343/g.67874 Transcript_34343/m.67874 type:complete len:549 (-) Transcript_34343:1183-2829(-)|eukprot:Cvel_13228.t1-p1 / transcript=Cvel_13228.t1 / gene=Cvel_13228 / organism=Chromera_velia_CCMP2878 / gene_product=Cryptochrome DASH, putative / transcript_product=Cryptochrome DASH, putative / location=Cvel_scaffold896:6126-8281(+) / protein_length=548 / sequence_SO=supercontig / SO=protein_coding / is_pseudo=false
MSKTAVICLLRNNLRWHDNVVLSHAFSSTADFVIPLFCWDSFDFKATHWYGFPRFSPRRFRFLQECVIDLDATLRSKGSALVSRSGDHRCVLLEVLRELEADGVKVVEVVMEEEPCTEEKRVERRVQKTCAEAGIAFSLLWARTLVHKRDLPFSERLPDVFTQFRKRAEAVQIREEAQMPSRSKPLPPSLEAAASQTNKCFIPPRETLGLPPLSGGAKDEETDERSVLPFKGGETAALERLHGYFFERDCLKSYKQTRNGLVGADYSSKFSPWLATGCLSPRRAYWEVKRYEEERVSNDSTYWLVFELLWRDYFIFVSLKYGSSLFLSGGIQGKDLWWEKPDRLFEAWRDGHTGVPFIDANMRELALSGFQSNRGRQNVASFLTKDMRVDWRLGAEWFESQLLDHDPASNYGNWNYATGIGNDPREDRRFNIIKQARDYDPEGKFVKLWCPELRNVPAPLCHTPWLMSDEEQAKYGCVLGQDYPFPVMPKLPGDWARHYGGERPHSSVPRQQATPSGFPSSKGGANGGGFSSQTPQRVEKERRFKVKK